MTRQLVSRRSITAGCAAIAASCVSLQTHAGTLVDVEDEIIQPQTPGEEAYIRRAFEMRQEAVNRGDQAYGAIVVRDKLIIGQSWSRVVLDDDPTAHAEMAAIRDAAMRSGSARLNGATMYSSSRPCPMCEAACYWAGIHEMIHGRSADSAGSPTICR